MLIIFFHFYIPFIYQIYSWLSLLLLFFNLACVKKYATAVWSHVTTVTRAFAVKTFCLQTPACNTQNSICDLQINRDCKRLHVSAKWSLNDKDSNQQRAPPQHDFTSIKHTDTASSLLLSKRHFPLKCNFCEWNKEAFVYRAAPLPRTIPCGSSTCPHTSWVVLSCFLFTR